MKILQAKEILKKYSINIVNIDSLVDAAIAIDSIVDRLARKQARLEFLEIL